MSVAIIEGQSGSETGHGDAMLDSSADCSAPWLLQQESKQNEDIIKFVYRTKLNHCESGHKLEVISRLLVTKTITAAFSSAQILQDSLRLQNLQRKNLETWEGEKGKNVLCTWVYWDGFNSDHLHTVWISSSVKCKGNPDHYITNQPEGWWLQDKLYCCFTPFLYLKKEEITCFFVPLSMWWLQVIAWPLPPSSYLAVLHSVTEESVQQQVLQLSVPVESLFDFTQEDTRRGKAVLMFSQHTVIKTPFKQSSMPFENFIPISWLVTVHCKLWVLNVRLRNDCARLQSKPVSQSQFPHSSLSIWFYGKSPFVPLFSHSNITTQRIDKKVIL